MTVSSCELTGGGACVSDFSIGDDDRQVIAGDAVGSGTGPLSVEGAVVNSLVVLGQTPTDLTQLPMEFLLDCSADSATTYVANKSRSAEVDQQVWLHFEVTAPGGLAYSIVTAGPGGVISGGDLLGGPGTSVPYYHAHLGFGTVTLIADPSAAAIPTAGGPPYGGSPDMFSGTNDNQPWIGSAGALFTVSGANPNPGYLGSAGTFSSKQGGTATGVLPPGEYTVGLYCASRSGASFSNGRSYQGAIEFEATARLVLSSPSP